MKRIMTIFLIVIIISSLSSCSLLNKTVVYKYSSITLPDGFAESEDSDSLNALDILANRLGKEILDSILQNIYIELDNKGNISVFNCGSISEDKTMNIEDLLTDEDIDVTVDGDILLISADGVILSFKKATDEELAIYKKLLENNTPSTETTSAAVGADDTLTGALQKLAEQGKEATESNTSKSEIDNTDEDLYMKQISVPARYYYYGTLESDADYILYATEDHDSPIDPGTYMLIPDFPSVIKTSEGEYPNSWGVFISDIYYGNDDVLPDDAYVGYVGDVDQATLRVDVEEGQFLYVLSWEDTGTGVGTCDLYQLQ